MKRLIAKTVDGYIASFPKPAQIMMQQLRVAIKATAPKAKEIISYDIPFYEYKSPGYPGRMIYYAAYKSHIGVYVVPRKVPLALAKQMAQYKVAKATLQFPIGTKIPIGMIKQLVKIRMQEIDQELKTKKKKV